MDEVKKLYKELSIPTIMCSLVDFPKCVNGRIGGRTIMLAELERPLLSRLNEAEMAALRDYTTIATTSVWVTNCGVLTAQEPEKMLGFGLGPSVRIEQPRFHVTRVDVEPSASDAASLSRSARLIVDTETKFHRNPTSSMDKELVEKGGIVYAARYYSDPVANAEFSRSWKSAAELSPIRSNMSLQFSQVGRLDSFQFHPDPSSMDEMRQRLGDDEVLIDNRAFAFDKQMVALARGHKSRDFFSLAAAGIVLAVGGNVHGINPNDRVTYLKPNKFHTTRMVKASSCIRLESTESFEDVVGQLVPFAIAVYVLRNLGKIRQGDTVLVDMGSEALSSALIQVALNARCTVYATFSSETERATLSVLEANGLHLIDSGEIFKFQASLKFQTVLTNGSIGLDNCEGLRNIVRRGARLSIFPSSQSKPHFDLAAISAALITKGLIINYVDPLDMDTWEENDLST